MRHHSAAAGMQQLQTRRSAPALPRRPAEFALLASFASVWALLALALLLVCFSSCSPSSVSAALPSPALQSLFDSTRGVLFNFSVRNPFMQVEWISPPPASLAQDPAAPPSGIVEFSARTQEIDLALAGNYQPGQWRIPTPNWSVASMGRGEQRARKGSILATEGRKIAGWADRLIRCLVFVVPASFSLLLSLAGTTPSPPAAPTRLCLPVRRPLRVAW